MRGWAGALLVTGVALSAAACASSEDGSGAPPPASSKAAGATPSPPPEFVGVGHPLPTGKALRNDPALYETVTLAECSKSDGGWQATGTAENTTSRRVAYSVLVFFTDAEARTVASARAVVTAPPGGTATWRAARRFEAEGVQCLVRSVTGR